MIREPQNHRQYRLALLGLFLFERQPTVDPRSGKIHPEANSWLLQLWDDFQSLSDLEAARDVVEEVGEKISRFGGTLRWATASVLLIFPPSHPREFGGDPSSWCDAASAASWLLGRQRC